MSKIMIIEDEPITAKLIAKKLKELKYQVIVVNDGYNGVNIAHKEMPDLIILDMMLPAGSGMTVLSRLKLSVNTNNIPIIALSGITDEAFKKNAIEKGIHTYLEKPYDPEILVKTIQDILNG